MNVIIFASGRGSNAKALIDGQGEYSVKALFCDVSDAPVIKMAKDHHIPVIVKEKQKSQSREDFDKEVIQLIQGYEFDLICLAGYRKLLSAHFINYFAPDTIINIHPSLLPKYPGLTSYQQAFDDKSSSGITIHYVDEGMDSGKIIAQQGFEFQEGDLFEEFQARGLAIEHQLYPSIVNKLSKKGCLYRAEVLPLSQSLMKTPGELVSRVYYIETQKPWAKLNNYAKSILSDSVSEGVFFKATPEYLQLLKSLAPDVTQRFEVNYLPGVTDNEGKATLEALSYFDETNSYSPSIQTAKFYRLSERLDPESISNPYLFHYHSAQNDLEVFSERSITHKQAARPYLFKEVDINLSDDELLKLNDESLWALSLEELKICQEYFNRLNRKPSDVEMEIIAQSWSEHCKHKIFAAQIEYHDTETSQQETITSLFKTYIKGATDKVIKDNEIDWAVSLFSDNAGVVRWDKNLDLAIKVETHNSPSALDPYGGAITGILGVNRDILGVGIGAKPIANTDVFCLAPHDLMKKAQSSWPVDAKDPRYIRRGVHAGVKDGGNKSGIPTVNGAFVYDINYAGKPLVYCGTVGVLPPKINNTPTHLKRQRPGDLIVMVGGKIGKDGIHGATFSSMEWKEGTPSTVVQIGDPLTQKRVSDFLLEARNQELYNSLTDNGAGGLSSSIGEMALDAGGATIDVAKAPVKYPGLTAAELTISESQERMSVSVPVNCIDEFLKLSKNMNVESTVIGEFVDSNEFTVKYNDKIVAQLSLDFLHKDLPPMKLKATYDKSYQPKDWIQKENHLAVFEKSYLKEALLKLLSHPNIRSHEDWVRMYDHEVQASTFKKPFSANGSPSDAGIVSLTTHGGEEGSAVGIASGIAPALSRYDAYLMTQWAVDESVRNLIASGVDPTKLALVDNFCWPDPIKSQKNPEGEHKLAQLVRSNKALFDMAVAYKAPFVSGKDSMKNDAHLKDIHGNPVKISVLPTLLVTAMGHVKDQNIISSYPQKDSQFVYLLNSKEIQGPLTLKEFYQIDFSPRKVDPHSIYQSYLKLYDLITKGQISFAHDVSEGGYLTALAEMCIEGKVGVKIKNTQIDYFGEGLGMIVFGSDRSDLADDTISLIGQTTQVTGLSLDSENIFWDRNELASAYQGGDR